MQPIDNRKLNKLFNEAKQKSCFIDDLKCSAKIIKAHSIQNNKILNKLSYNGEVIMIASQKDNLGFTTELVGRKKATVFTGFCGYHDNIIFLPIEEKDYCKYDKEQEFLFAFRALAKEYYTALNSYNVAKKNFKAGL